jgi:hypothetical protein
MRKASTVLLRLGDIYHRLEDLKAIWYYEKALKLSEIDKERIRDWPEFVERIERAIEHALLTYEYNSKTKS